MQNNLIFGMPTLIENKNLDENIALAKRLGLKFIELNMNFPEYQLPELQNTDELNKKAAAASLFYTIHLDENLNFADFNPLVREAYLKTTAETIKFAKKINAKKINMHMNDGIYITLPDQKVFMYNRNFDVYMTYTKIFRELCEKEIGSSNIKICLENTDGFHDFEEKAIDYLLESPVFALTWDIGHSKATKEKDLPFITARENHLSHFHIHDGTENPPKNHLALGDGCIDLPARLNLALKHNCTCVLETKTIAALEKSINWLKNQNNFI